MGVRSHPPMRFHSKLGSREKDASNKEHSSRIKGHSLLDTLGVQPEGSSTFWGRGPFLNPPQGKAPWSELVCSGPHTPP